MEPAKRSAGISREKRRQRRFAIARLRGTLNATISCQPRADEAVGADYCRDPINLHGSALAYQTHWPTGRSEILFDTAIILIADGKNLLRRAAIRPERLRGFRPVCQTEDTP